MVGSSVMFTPKGLSVIRRVSRIASRSASGLGWVSAVRMPGWDVSYMRALRGLAELPRAPALETAAAREGTPTHCMPP